MGFFNLADLGRSVDPEGKIADMAELLSQANAALDDAPMVEANGMTGHLTTLRTALPKGTYRRFYQGVGYTKSLRAQVEFGMSLLVAYSQIDKKLAEIAGVGATREKEDVAHMEGFSQQQSTTIFYGNSWINPEQFTGFATFYNTVALATAQAAVNTFDAGGTASSNTSIWLIGWGDSTVYGIYPKNSKGGLVFEDKGDVVPGFDASNNRFEAYTSYFEWALGLAVEDWRYNVRICNIDTTNAAGGLAGTTPPDLFAIMSKALVRLPTAGRTVSGITKTDAPDKVAPAVRLKFYCDRTARQYMDIQAIRDKNVLLSPRDYAGEPIVNFRNVPIEVQDSLLDTESRVV